MQQVTKALTLNDLPAPPSGKTGWPWTEQSEPVGDQMSNGSEYPRISIVTPSYNQGQFIEETIRSVLLQGYPNLEYIIIDGGSTDDSVEIIKKYEPFLAYWVSEKDRGQSHAINKGLMQASGDYLAWMNSDDCYMLGGLAKVSTVVQVNFYDFIYGCTYVGSDLQTYKIVEGKGTKNFCLRNLLRFFYNLEYIIPSQSVLISRHMFNKIGYLNESLHYCMDLDWFARVAIENPNVYRVDEPICFYRVYPEAKTSKYSNTVIAEAINIAKGYSGHLNPIEYNSLSRLIQYSLVFHEYGSGKRPKTLIENLKTLCQFPLEALSDTRFLGLCKQSMINLFKSK